MLILFNFWIFFFNFVYELMVNIIVIVNKMVECNIIFLLFKLVNFFMFVEINGIFNVSDVVVLFSNLKINKIFIILFINLFVWFFKIGW